MSTENLCRWLTVIVLSIIALQLHVLTKRLSYPADTIASSNGKGILNGIEDALNDITLELSGLQDSISRIEQ